MSETAILDRLRNGLIRSTRQSLEIVCLNANLTASTVELSSPSDDPRKVSHADRIDRDLMAYLMHRKIINWCDKTCKLAPLKNNQTNGSGLLRAVANSIWGLQDEAIDFFLRRLLHVALTSGKQQPTFKERWQLEQEQANFNSDAQSHSKETWEDVCCAFQGNELQTEKSSITLLDPIHIFSLSNILRRPVLVLSDIPSANSRSPSSSIRDLTGLYLPLLSSAESCVPYPLVLVRHEGLFRALLVNRVSLEWWQVQSFRSIPLIRVDQEPFHVRCLLTSESRRVRHLLLSYLNIAEISHTTPSGPLQVLTCRLSTVKPLPESPESERVSSSPVLQTKPFSESSLVTDEAPSDGEAEEGLHPLTGSTSRFEGGCVPNCIACQTIKRAEQRKGENTRPWSESEAGSVRGKRSTRCENVQCEKEGSQKYGGRCYTCYVVKDPWLGVSKGEEKLRNIEFMNKEEELTCPTLEKMRELRVADSVKDSRKANDLNDTTRHKDTIVETEITDTQKSIRVKNTQELANPKHILESEHVRDKSVKVKGRHGSKHDTRAGDPGKTSCANESMAFRSTCRAMNDPQPTVEHLVTSDHQTPDLVGAPEERQSAPAKKCIVDFCSNAAENAHRGLCRTCYQILLRHRTSRDKEEQSARPVSSSATVASSQCLMEDCVGPVTNQQLGLCLSCIRTQIFAARDLERRRQQQRSSLRHSENPSRTSKVDLLTIALPDERSSRSKRQRIPKSPSDIHSARVPPSPPGMLNYLSSSRTRAKCCLTADCDRYGDPSFDGYCSLCHERLSPGLLVPRS